ncbi:hypothetical protein [Salana multivorans]
MDLNTRLLLLFTAAKVRWHRIQQQGERGASSVELAIYTSLLVLVAVALGALIKALVERYSADIH